MSVVVDALEVQVKETAASASGAVAQLATALHSAKNAMKPLANSTERWAAALKSVGFDAAFKGASQLNVQMWNLSDTMKQIKRDTNGVASAVSKVVDASQKTTIEGTTTAVDKLSKAVDGVGDAAKSTGKSVKAVKEDLDDASKSSNSFFSSIVRIAKYRLIRTAMKYIVQGFTDGIDRMYEFSKATGTDFASNMDSLASSVDYLTSSIGSLVQPLVDALTPALTWVIELVADLASEIGYLVSILFSTDFVEPTKRAVEYSSSLSDVADAAADAKAELMGFDELNVINSPSSGSSTSGSASATSALTAYTTTTTRKQVIDSSDDVLDAIVQMVDDLDKYLKKSDNVIAEWFDWKFFRWWDLTKETLGDETFYSILENLPEYYEYAFTKFLQKMVDVLDWVWDKIDQLFSAIADNPITAGLFPEISGSIDTLRACLDTARSSFGSVSDELGQKAEELEDKLKSLTSTTHKLFKEWQDAQDNLTFSYTVTSTTSSYKEAQSEKFALKHFATGGIPEQGSLALIGETVGETEILGNVNGRTGVVGGAEITGIADAVYATGSNETTLLREQNSLLRQLIAKSGNINLVANAQAGKWIAQSNRAYAKATGV